jgi:hypothetical protein
MVALMLKDCCNNQGNVRGKKGKMLLVSMERTYDVHAQHSSASLETEQNFRIFLVDTAAL